MADEAMPTKRQWTIRAHSWVASVSAWAEKHRVLAYGSAAVFLIGIVASVLGILSFFEGEESSRRIQQVQVTTQDTNEQVREATKLIEAFVEAHGIQRVRDELDIGTLNACYVYGWALYYLSRGGALTFVPLNTGDPTTRVDWSRAAIVQGDGTDEILVQAPGLSIERPNGTIRTGLQGGLRSGASKEPGTAGGFIVLGAIAIDHQTLANDRDGLTLFMGVRKEPAIQICSELPPVTRRPARVGTSFQEEGGFQSGRLPSAFAHR